MSDLFFLRPAREEDAPAINSYAYWEGMDNMPSMENITVAESAAGDVVGFIRVVKGANDIMHVNPVVTASNWRGYQVGRELVESQLAQYGELRLVSRGNAVGFYETLGFTSISWDDVDRSVCDDCENCEMREECAPLPMGLKK